MMDLYLIFQFVKGRCHGNQITLTNEGKLILCAFFARSPDGRVSIYARLCHAFLVIYFHMYICLLCFMSTVRYSVNKDFYTKIYFMIHSTRILIGFFIDNCSH